MNITTFFAQASDYYNSYSYSSGSEDAALAAAGIGMAFFLFSFLFGIAIYVVSSLSLMKIFKKAGLADAWAAWIPFYNTWRMLEIGGQQGFWAVLAIIPIANIVSAVFVFIAAYHIGLKLGKSGAFVLLAIFLALVWYLWLAFDKSTWNEDAEGSAPSLVPLAPPVAATPAAPTATPQI